MRVIREGCDSKIPKSCVYINPESLFATTYSTAVKNKIKCASVLLILVRLIQTVVVYGGLAMFHLPTVAQLIIIYHRNAEFSRF